MPHPHTLIFLASATVGFLWEILRVREAGRLDVWPGALAPMALAWLDLRWKVDVGLPRCEQSFTAVFLGAVQQVAWVGVPQRCTFLPAVFPASLHAQRLGKDSIPQPVNASSLALNGLVSFSIGGRR